jgi:hypothetical protein
VRHAKRGDGQRSWTQAPPSFGRLPSLACTLIRSGERAQPVIGHKERVKTKPTAVPSFSSLFAALRLSPSCTPPAEVLPADAPIGASQKNPASLPEGLTPQQASAPASDLAPRAALPDARPRMSKQVPYYSEKPDRDIKVSLNCQAPYPGAPEGSNEVVECRHLALTWASQVQATGRPDYAAFSSKDAIRKNVQPEAEALHFDLLTRSPDVQLVPLDQWGGFVAQQLKSLEAAGAPAARQWLVNSGNHAMALELKVKQAPSGKRYVARFYDPNLTATHKRMGSNSIAEFEALTVTALLNNPSLQQAYFGKESVAMVVALSPGGATSLPPANDPDRRVAGPIPPLDASVMDPLLAYGFAGTLRDLKQQVVELASQHPAKAEHLLAARGSDGSPGLSFAVLDGHAHTVGTFIDLVAASGLDKPAQMRLLAAQARQGELGLAEAVGKGKPEAARAYVDALDRHPLLEASDKAQLAATRGPDRRTALVHALVAGRPETVAALTAWVARLDVAPQVRCDLLVAIDHDGSPALGEPMQLNAADRVMAYARAVLDSPMSDREKVYVLRGGAPAGQLLAAAGRQGARHAIDAYRTAILRSSLPMAAKAALLRLPAPPVARPQPQRVAQTAH